MWFTILALPVKAQSGISITPRAGLNMATISPTKTSIIKPGINFGATMEWLFTSKVGLELGALYSMQGVNFQPSTATHEYQINPSHDYILVPLLFKMYINNKAGVTEGFNIFAGGQLDLKAVVDKVGYTDGYEGQLLPNDINRPYSFSAVGGIGYLLSSGLCISANLNWGITNIANSKFLVYTDKPPATKEVSIGATTYRNIIFQLNFGYRFSLSKGKAKQQDVEAIFELF